MPIKNLVRTCIGKCIFHRSSFIEKRMKIADVSCIEKDLMFRVIQNRYAKTKSLWNCSKAQIVNIFAAFYITFFSLCPARFFLYLFPCTHSQNNVHSAKNWKKLLYICVHRYEMKSPKQNAGWQTWDDSGGKGRCILNAFRRL